MYGWYIRSVYRFHYRLLFTFLHHVCLIQVTIALRFHLFPFRTEKLSSVTPMVLRNSGRVGSRRFFREKPLYRKMQGLSCFWAIIPNREVKFICLPCLVLLALLFFSLFCLFSWGQQIFSGDYFILVKYFSFFAFRILYRITSYPYHIIYLASISSYILLFLCLKECYASVYLPLSSLFMVTFDYEIR